MHGAQSQDGLNQPVELGQYFPHLINGLLVRLYGVRVRVHLHKEIREFRVAALSAEIAMQL